MALPELSSYFQPLPDAPVQGPVSAAPQPSGTGYNWFTSALGSGVHQAMGEFGSAGEAVGRVVGANTFADRARAFADAQRQAAATYQRPDLESAPWYDPEAIAYRTLQGLPTWGAALAGAGIGAAVAPEVGAAGLVGGAAAMLPSAIGGNVQRREDYAGKLDQSNALKAIGLGVPEAAIQGLAPHYLESGLLKGFGSSLLSSVGKAAAIQAPVAAATEWATQAMGDPNRSFADRASDIVQAGLSGGILGGATGALLHPLNPGTHEIAKEPPQNVGAPQLQAVIDSALNPPQPIQPVAAPGDIFRARMQAVANSTGVQGPPDLSGAIPMPPPADEAARLQQASLDAGRAARPVARQPGDLGSRMAAIGGEGAVEGPGQPPAAPPAPMPFGRGGPRLPIEGPPKPAGLLPPPGPTPTPDEAPFDWAAQRKQLQQAKGWSNIVKGPFTNREDLVNTVFDNLNSRLNSDNPKLPKPLMNAAHVLGIVDDNGQFTPEFAQRADQAAQTAARPPGITAADDNATELSGPTSFQAPERLEKADIPKAHQDRWDALEQLRNKLLADDTSDPKVQALVNQTAELQNSLLKPAKSGPTSWRNIDRATQSILAQVEARGTEAAVTPTAPSAGKNAPATGPQPSPAANAFIDRAVAPEAPANVQTKEAKAKQARKGKASPAPAPEAPEAAPPPPAMSLKEADARDAVARGEAPPGLTPEEAQAATPNPAFTTDTAVTPREQGIERDGRYWDYLQTSHPNDIEARAQAQEAVAPREPATPTIPTASQTFTTREERARAARKAMLAKRAPEDVAARGDIENQRTPEVVRPKLAPSVDEVPESAGRVLNPEVPADRRALAAQEANAQRPPMVDPASLSGFQRAGRKLQSDVRRQSQVDDLKARLAMIESSKRPVTPVPAKVMEQLDRARSALTNLEQSGAIIPRHEDFAGKDQDFQRMLAQHREQLDLVERAAKIGGMEGLREVPRDFFGTDLYDNMSGHVTPQTERALQQHATAESQLQDAAAVARGERPLIHYSTPPTQHDVDLRAIVDQTGKMSSALEYIRENGSTPLAKLLAHTLLEHGAGGTVEMGDRRTPNTARQLQEGETVGGEHFVNSNHTVVYDGGQMEHTLLHEAAHSATARAINAGTPEARDLGVMFDHLKASDPDNDAYGLENLHEFVAEAFSNPQFQQYLKGITVRYGTKPTNMWQAFKNGVARVLGITARSRSLFDDVMDRATRLMGENVREASGDINLQVMRGGQQFSTASTQVSNALIRRLQRTFDERGTKTTEVMRRTALGLMTTDHIAKLLQDRVNEATNFVGHQNHRTVRTGMLSKTLLKALNTVQGLDKKGRDAWNRLATRTIQNIDPFRPWKDHVWLKDHPQEAELKQEHEAAARDADILRRIPGGEEAWKTSIDANENARHLRETYLAYDLQQREFPGETWVGFHNDPIREYEASTALHDDPAVARAATEARKAQMMVGLKAKAQDLATEINTLKTKQSSDAMLPTGDPHKMTPEQHQALDQQIKKVMANREAITSLVGDAFAMDERAKQGPYFHLGRSGEHFVTAHVITDNGVPNDYAVSKIAEAMAAKGFTDHAIMRGVDNSSIYVRLEGQTQRKQMFDLMHEMKDQGYVDPKKPIARGLASDTSIYSAVSPAYMRQAIEAVRASQPDYPPGISAQDKAALTTAHEHQIQEMTRSLMDMLPDTSLTKLYQKRENVQGFNTNMLDSYKASAISNARGLSNMSLSRELGASAVLMKKQLEGLNQRTDISEGQLTAASQAMGELALRNKLYQAHVPSTFMDGVRRMVHTFQIGASPAYVLTLMSQIPTLTLPELAKTHGYARSAVALGKTAAEAFKVMRAVWNSEEGNVFGMRRDALEKAGINPKTIDFLMHLDARGAFNAAGYTEAMTGHQTEGSIKKFTEVANVMGRYSEQFPRILTALAARDLHENVPQKTGGMNVHDFAYNKVMDSQFNWNPELNARQTTRSGDFGAMSPLINQFMGFQIRMTEKLYREVAAGLGSKRGTEEGRQARTWLYGHAAAVTMLAGTLGLPMVAVAASVFDRLADLITGKDSWDVTAMYRSFLAKSFGKEMGEAISRGLPRIAGLDFDHLGEGRIAPGSSLLMLASEKRKLEDAEKDWLKNMAGSSMGFIFNVAAGARDFMNGDIADGFVHTMPEIIKNGVEAYRIGHRGFVDKMGNKLPITATASDVMAKAIGIDPADEAEYDEVKSTATGLQQMRAQREQNITRHLVLATNRGDQGMMQHWQEKAVEYQQDHPGMPNPLQEFSRQLMLHARNAAFASGLGTPIGVQPRDIVSRELTSYGNLRNGS